MIRIWESSLPPWWQWLTAQVTRKSDLWMTLDFNRWFCKVASSQELNRSEAEVSKQWKAGGKLVMADSFLSGTGRFPEAGVSRRSSRQLDDKNDEITERERIFCTHCCWNSPLVASYFVFYRLLECHSPVLTRGEVFSGTRPGGRHFFPTNCPQLWYVPSWKMQ